TAGPVAAAAPQTTSTAPQNAVQAAVGPATTTAPAAGPVTATAPQTAPTAPQNAVQAAAAAPPPVLPVATLADAPAFSTRAARARRAGTAPPSVASNSAPVQHNAPVRPSQKTLGKRKANTVKPEDADEPARPATALGKRKATTVEPEDADEPVRPAKARKTAMLPPPPSPIEDNTNVQPRVQPAVSTEDAADALLSVAAGADNDEEEEEEPNSTEPLTWANATVQEKEGIVGLAMMKLEPRVKQWIGRSIVNGDIQLGL
ncbi:hypothetical protein LTS18_012744, partial [Coniosporium uncinatum]